MPSITFLSHDGTASMIEAETGLSLMEAALRAGIDGIDADCGGACACGTCRVIIGTVWRDRIGGPGDLEAIMLELAPEPSAGARLSCQIPVTEDLNGLTVTVPSEQFR